MDNLVPAEQELIKRCRLFDHQALAQVYDTYSLGIHRYALRLLGDQALAEECTAETFSRFLHALKIGSGPRDHLQAYLYRVAHNWIVDQYRREPSAALELIEDMPEKADLPEEEAAKSERWKQLQQALMRLTPDQQQVITLKYLEGWDNEEIARALKKPVGSVKSLQHRALRTMDRMLTGKDEL
jgi:RNA polymerase sigma-70 factor (ECF subfamily)